jgi:hypothetical protein
MGHYEANREFDDEWRARAVPTLRPPMPEPVVADPNQVVLRVEHLTPQTFKRWTDGPKWILDTMGAGFERPQGVGSVRGSVAEINDFLQTYPHPVGTFYVFASHLRYAVEIAEDNPTRDIRFLLMPKDELSVPA